MATKDLRELRREAKAAGIRGFKGMDRDELVAALRDAGGGTAKRGRPAKKRSTSAPAKKRTTAKRGTRSTAKRQTSGRSAKSTKRSAPARASRNSNGDAGRNLLGKINWSDTEGWNARPGSPRDEIQKALRKARGDREKVFAVLVKRIRDFVSVKKADGTKRTKAEQEAYLRYLISRVAFDFAVKTGQHEPSANRAQYGTGGTGTGAFNRRNNKRTTRAASKPKATRSTAKRSTARKGTRKRKTARK